MATVSGEMGMPIHVGSVYDCPGALQRALIRSWNEHQAMLKDKDRAGGKPWVFNPEAAPDPPTPDGKPLSPYE